MFTIHIQLPLQIRCPSREFHIRILKSTNIVQILIGEGVYLIRYSNPLVPP